MTTPPLDLNSAAKALAEEIQNVSLDLSLDAELARYHAIILRHFTAWSEQWKKRQPNIHAEVHAERDLLEKRVKELESQLTDAITERDMAEEWADRIASAAGEVGEHSNLNNPWANALDLIHALRTERDQLAEDKKRLEEQLADSEYKHTAEYHNKIHGPSGIPHTERGYGSYHDDDRA